MLKKTPLPALYLTAAELGITEREREGLIYVRNDLASGRVRHVEKIVIGDDLNMYATGFNMSLFSGNADCGTTHCIGGFMQARRVWNGDLLYSSALKYLFYAGECGASRLTPAQAVRAIDHFLCGAGAECWSLALQDIPLTP